MVNKDELPVFSRSDPHDMRVPVMLTADEFLFARDTAEEKGLSLGAYFRMLLKNDRKALAYEKLSAYQKLYDSANPAQDLDNFIKMVNKFNEATK